MQLIPFDIEHAVALRTALRSRYLPSKVLCLKADGRKRPLPSFGCWNTCSRTHQVQSALLLLLTTGKHLKDRERPG